MTTTRLTARKLVAGLALGAAATLGVAACGSGTTKTQPNAPVKHNVVSQHPKAKHTSPTTKAPSGGGAAF